VNDNEIKNKNDTESESKNHIYSEN